MARFDVFRNEHAPGNKQFPYLLAVQSDLLAELRTCVVVPLGRASTVGGRAMDKLMPELQLDGDAWVMYTPELAALPASALRRKVANLKEQSHAILCALDFLFSGI
ncbi:CcdB family protein [Frateuria sp. STR12]|uniref:CcdB family protein n=1 Tax=Frateuria hangzhouensis TaxID=2995589 RepID=UPI002260A5D2|nr:CcdB family protein [Frateuria sp. STR12]MCX7514578.1 CcdB family protein [Frateuria sp. STR12]